LWEGFFAYIQTVIRISNWGISEEMIADLFRKIPGREGTRIQCLGFFKARCTFALALGRGGRDEAWWDIL
jgi:hypothetical protein